MTWARRGETHILAVTPTVRLLVHWRTDAGRWAVSADIGGLRALLVDGMFLRDDARAMAEELARHLRGEVEA